MVVLNDAAHNLLASFDQPLSPAAQLEETLGYTTILRTAIGRLIKLGLTRARKAHPQCQQTQVTDYSQPGCTSLTRVTYAAPTVMYLKRRRS